MQDVKQPLIERITYLIENIGSGSRGGGFEDWPDIELTMPQVRVLVFLADAPKRTSDIARFWGGALSATTTMIDRLVNKKLVQREPDPHDRRVVLCRLTSEGIDAIEQFSRINRLRIERVATVLSVEELEAVARAMEILSTGIDRLTWSHSAKT